MNYTHGAELIVDFSGGEVKVLRAISLDKVPALRAGRTRITADAGVRREAEAVTMTILDARGRTLASGVYDTRAVRFVDWIDPKTGALTGGPQYIRPDERDIRVVRVPLPHDGWLNFHRTEVGAGGGGLATRRAALALFDAGPAPGRDAPAFEDPDLPRPAGPLALPWRARVKRSGAPGSRPEKAVAATASGFTLPGPPPDYAGGKFIGTETIEDHGENKFNIVIAGDGFQEAELDRFDDLAKRLHHGFKKMKPFKEVRHLINWHVARAASTDSGVTYCPDDEPRATFYQTQGCWGHTAAPRTFIGADETGLDLIQWAAEEAVGGEPIGLIIVIVNCDYYGGHAWPDRQIAFVSASWARPRLLVGMAAHECAHVIGKTAEEYISVTPADLQGLPKPPDQGPNTAALAEVSASVRRRLLERAPSGVKSVLEPVSDDADTVWWLGLAHHDERRKDKKSFIAVHAPGDHVEGIRPRLNPSSREKRLGVFWGGQATAEIEEVWLAYSDLLGLPADASPEVRQRLQRDLRLPLAKEVPDTSVWWDPRGALHFRPMAMCRMRQVTHEFCRVCTHVLTNRIREACGEKGEGPAVPGC